MYRTVISRREPDESARLSDIQRGAKDVYSYIGSRV